jgi:hypothetical protein
MLQRRWEHHAKDLCILSYIPGRITGRPNWAATRLKSRLVESDNWFQLDSTPLSLQCAASFGGRRIVIEWIKSARRSAVGIGGVRTIPRSSLSTKD